jgi:hypothetical protein
MKVDVTITATRRAEVLDQTLLSFFTKFFNGHDIRLIVNIDPIGPDRDNTNVIRTCRQWTDNVLFNEPETCNFAAAVKWVWSQAAADYVFNLEDDWVLCGPPAYLSDMIRLHEKHKDLAHLRLSQYPANGHSVRQWNKWFPFNGEFFECPEEMKRGVGFCGHPSLNKLKFIKKAADLLMTDHNPEKQFHAWNKPLIDWGAKWRYGVYGQPCDPNRIMDIGRKWIVNTNFRKEGNKAFFLKWTEEAQNES